MIEAVLSMFREPSLCRHVHRECMRSALLDVTPLISATACHQRNDVERYRRLPIRPINFPLPEFQVVRREQPPTPAVAGCPVAILTRVSDGAGCPLRRH